jgi:hypothetical protein
MRLRRQKIFEAINVEIGADNACSTQLCLPRRIAFDRNDVVDFEFAPSDWLTCVSALPSVRSSQSASLAAVVMVLRLSIAFRLFNEPRRSVRHYAGG